MVGIMESLLSLWRQISVKGCHKSCDAQPHFWPVGKMVCHECSIEGLFQCASKQGNLTGPVSVIFQRFFYTL